MPAFLLEGRGGNELRDALISQRRDCRRHNTIDSVTSRFTERVHFSFLRFYLHLKHLD